MTTIIVKKTENGNYKGFTCTGHAGFAGKGRDIVCAAVSALVITTINSMEELADENMETTTREKTGFIDCRFLGDLSDKGKLLMDSMVLGLTGIEKQYGGRYLMLKFEEV